MSTFVVLGTPRGGTSAVAGLLRIFGIPMGFRVNEASHEDLEMRQAEILDQYIKERNEEFDDWGWKDPTLIDRLTMDDVRKLRDPKLLVIFRDLVAVASSELERAGRSLRGAVEQTLIRHHKMFQWLINEDVESYALSYENALREPEEFITLLTHLSDVELDDVQRNRAMEFLDGPGYKDLDGNVMIPEEDRC